MKKKTFIISMSVLIFLIGAYIIITNYLIASSEYDMAIRYDYSQEIYKEIIDKLDETNIPYKIDKVGFIHFRNIDNESVEKIVEEIEAKYSSKEGSGQSFTNAQYMDYFKKLLKKEGIPYKIKKLDSAGNDYVIWEKKYDVKVQNLIKKVYEKIGLTKNPPIVVYPDSRERDIFIKLLQKEEIPYKLTKNTQTGLTQIEFSWKDYGKIKKLEQKIDQIKESEGK